MTTYPFGPPVKPAKYTLGRTIRNAMRDFREHLSYAHEMWVNPIIRNNSYRDPGKIVGSALLLTLGTLGLASEVKNGIEADPRLALDLGATALGAKMSYGTVKAFFSSPPNHE